MIARTRLFKSRIRAAHQNSSFIARSRAKTSSGGAPSIPIAGPRLSARRNGFVSRSWARVAGAQGSPLAATRSARARTVSLSGSIERAKAALAAQ